MEKFWFVVWVICCVGTLVGPAAGLIVQHIEYRKPLGQENLHAGRRLMRSYWIFMPLTWLTLLGWAF